MAIDVVADNFSEAVKNKHKAYKNHYDVNFNFFLVFKKIKN